MVMEKFNTEKKFVYISDNPKKDFIAPKELGWESIRYKNPKGIYKDYENNAITAIEVMDDENLLVLERAYAGIRKPFVITLRKVFLNQCNKNNQCRSEVLTTFNSFEGWTVNNYEGLARVGNNRYLMISDNNNEKFLATQLIYFKIN